MTMYYSENNGEPFITIQVKDAKYTLTQAALAEIIEKNESLKVELEQSNRMIRSLGWDVREFFESRQNSGEDEIICSVEDVNELLLKLNVDPLVKTWSATVLISATITGIEAVDADAARELIENNIEVNLTEDGDLWVDDIDVSDVHPES
jgi:predicted DNA-binding protein (UPF0278 family)